MIIPEPIPRMFRLQHGSVENQHDSNALVGLADDVVQLSFFHSLLKTVGW